MTGTKKGANFGEKWASPPKFSIIDYIDDIFLCCKARTVT